MTIKKNAPYIIAEIGINHEGNFNLAKKSIKSAKIALEQGRESAVSEFDSVQGMLASSNDAKEGVESLKTNKSLILKVIKNSALSLHLAHQI